MNYLDDWYDQTLALKWKLVLHEHPYLRELDAIRDELRGFLPAQDLDAGNPVNKHNWLLHLFADKQPNSVYVLNEVAELIRYFRLLGSPPSLQLHTADGAIDYRSLQDRLLELQVHYLLTSIGCKPLFGQNYLKADGTAKPIDMTITAGDRTYTVETTKYYDGYKEALLALGTRILGKIALDANTGAYRLDEVFSGYLLYKQKNDKLLNQGYQVFTSGLKAFLHGYRGAKANTILLPAKKSTEDYEFMIEPGFADQYDQLYDQLGEGHPAFIKFRISANIQNYRSHIDLRITAADNREDRNKRLIEKIREKRRQHRESPNPLLIVIAIEEVFTSHPKNRTQAITSQDIDEQALHEHIRGKCTVLLLFKRLKPDGVTYHKMILGDLANHAELIEHLKAIDPVIYYRGRHYAP